MRKNSAIVIGVGAMMCFLISLPMNWYTIDHARRAFDIGTITTTGLHGSITLWVESPVWLIVCVSMLGVVFSLLNRLELTTLSKMTCLAPLFFSSLFICKALMITLSRNGNFRMGLFFALLGLVLGFCLAVSNSGQRTMDDLMRETLYEDLEP